MIKSWLEKHIYKIFMTPTIVFILFMIIFPLIYTVYLSFTEWSMGIKLPEFIGFENYKAILTDKIFWSATGRTIYYAFGSVGIELIIGTAIALFLNRKFRGKSLIKTIFILPMVATPIAMGMVWLLIFEPTIGVANYLLKIIGLQPVMWLVNTSNVLNSLVMVSVWQSTPMITLILMAGLAGLPTDPFESAVVDGANKWQMLRKITLPLLAPTMVIAVLLRLIDALKSFDVIFAMTAGGPLRASETLNLLTYNTIFGYFQMGKGSAMIILFLGVIGIVCAFVIAIRRKVSVEN